MNENVEFERYTIDMYKSDIKAAALFGTREDDGPKVKGAAYAAASKRLKQSIALDWVTNATLAEKIDMTPTLANHLVKAWIGRGISRAELAKIFAVEGRTAANKSADHDKVDLLVAKYKESVTKDIQRAVYQMQIIRDAMRISM